MPSRLDGPVAGPSQGAARPANSSSSNYGSIPFANVTIMGIPWVLFCLLALSFGLIVSALFKTVSWTIAYLGRRSKVVGSPAEEAKADQQQPQLSSPHEIPSQPPPRPLSPPPCWRMATQTLFPLPPFPESSPVEAAPSSLLPGAGEFRGSRSMPPTYVPTPFLMGASPHPSSPIHYYY